MRMHLDAMHCSCAQTCVQTCVQTFVWTCAHQCPMLPTANRVRAPAHACMHICTHAYTHACTHVYTHVYAHAYTHVHSHAALPWDFDRLYLVISSQQCQHCLHTCFIVICVYEHVYALCTRRYISMHMSMRKHAMLLCSRPYRRTPAFLVGRRFGRSACISTYASTHIAAHPTRMVHGATVYSQRSYTTVTSITRAG